MMVNNDIRHGKDKLELLGKKVIHYQHHAHFLDVFLTLKVIPKGLEIKKTKCIRVTDNKFMEKWNVTLQNTGMTLMHQLQEKGVVIHAQTYSDFFDQIKNSLSNAISINDVRDLAEKFTVEQNELFNRRITKFIKVAKQPDIRDLRKRMQILRTLSKGLHELYQTQAEKLHHITTGKKRTTEQHLTGNEVNQEKLEGQDKHKPHNVTVIF